MKKLLAYSSIILVLACLLSMNCVKNIAGGTEVGNPSVSAMIYNPGGSPAVHAKVRFFPVNYNPRTGGLAKTLATTADSTTTDAHGNYTARLDTGTYNVLASSDSGMVYQDSIIVVKDSTLHPPADTLKAPGGLRGRVRLQPGDDARTVLILFFGTNTWGAPDDSTGKFTVSNMAEGTYRVRFLTTLDAYVPKDTVLSVTAGKVDSLGHDIVLQYTGIPVPSGLTISYDTLKQIVSLSWNKPTTGRTIQGYNVYRKQQDSTLIRIKSDLIDTVFSDSTLRASSTYEYRITAIDTQNNEGTQSLAIFVGFQNRFSLATDSAEFGPRVEHTSLVFNGKIWVIAGGLLNDVWSSTDGITWTKVADTTAFSGRRSHASVVFNNEMWVIGGKDANILQDDVWHSSDGINWVLATDSAGFSGRMNHAAVVFENKIWVIGGYDGISEKNDVWQSSDGTVWIKVTENAGFSARAGLTADVFNSELLIIGGVGPTTYFNDIWSSSDGITWTVVSAKGRFTGRFDHTATIFQNQIWVVGGENVDGNSNEVWSSSNGIDWQKFNTPYNFTGKVAHAAVVFYDKLWIIGRAMLLNGGLNKTDVWSLK